MFLVSRGHPTTVCNDGAALLETIKSDPRIKMVFANWLLPGVDGWQAYCQLSRQHGCQIRCILMVPEHYAQDIIDNFHCASGFLQKPLFERDIETLMTRFERMDDESNSAQAFDCRHST